jgi:hypothetical protein
MTIESTNFTSDSIKEDPHTQWKNRVIKENPLIVINGLNQVIMRADNLETLIEWWPRTVKNFMHARVYQEIDISAELAAAQEKIREKEARGIALRAERYARRLAEHSRLYGDYYD